MDYNLNYKKKLDAIENEGQVAREGSVSKKDYGKKFITELKKEWNL